MKLFIKEFNTPQARFGEHFNLLKTLEKKFPGKFFISENTLYWKIEDSEYTVSNRSAIPNYVDGWIDCLENI
jgi:hypothetical protein